MKYRFNLSMIGLLLAIGWLWAVLINHLRIEWSVNPQYAYGWAVPFMCAYLLWQRLKEPVNSYSRSVNHAKTQSKSEKPDNNSLITENWPLAPDNRPTPPNNHSLITDNWLRLSAFILLALLWLPVRLVQEANPEWRLVSWALAFITIGITLLAARAWIGGARQRYPLSINRDGAAESVSAGTDNNSLITSNPLRFSDFVFPILFFLVAVPWPTVVEGPLVQALTRANAGVTIEILNLIGIPAIQHGNVIEVSTGVVGIDEACSGIRSFQATLMIALFFGELYRLSVVRRLSLCFAGFALSFGFNVIRTTLLTGVASREGVDAIARWHDPAGVTILVGCFLALWLLSLLFKKLKSETLKAEGESSYPLSVNGLGAEPQSPPATGNDSPTTHNPSSIPDNSSQITNNRFSIPAIALLLWLLIAETSVEAWYRTHERNLPDPVTWTVNWPEDNPTFQVQPMPEKTEQFLRFDEGRDARWVGEYGRRWQAIFLRWNPGRTAVHLAKGHTPETCLAAVGYEPELDPELTFMEVHGLALPFQHYTLNVPGAPAHVYYCLWEDRAADRRFELMGLTYANRLEPVLAGRRLTGQRSLEIVVNGIADPVQAEAALREQLPKLIRVGEE